jgi:DNA invertase Pin-like site-specific DNA recombinase
MRLAGLCALAGVLGLIAYLLTRPPASGHEDKVTVLAFSPDGRILPAMNRLMDAARRRAVDAIVCWKIDRWGWSMAGFVSSVQELGSLGVRFIAVTQGTDTDESNPTSRLMLNLLAAFAEFERELIVERTRAGLQRARREGRVGGRPRLVVNRAKVAQLDSEGMTMREIGEELDISAASVCRILQPASMRGRTRACSSGESRIGSCSGGRTSFWRMFRRVSSVSPVRSLPCRKRME